MTGPILGKGAENKAAQGPGASSFGAMLKGMMFTGRKKKKKKEKI